MSRANGQLDVDDEIGSYSSFFSLRRTLDIECLKKSTMKNLGSKSMAGKSRCTKSLNSKTAYETRLSKSCSSINLDLGRHYLSQL